MLPLKQEQNICASWLLDVIFAVYSSSTFLPKCRHYKATTQSAFDAASSLMSALSHSLKFAYYLGLQIKLAPWIYPSTPVFRLIFKKDGFLLKSWSEERLAQGSTWLNGSRHSRLPLKTPRRSSGIQCDLSWWKCRKWYFNNIVMTFQYKGSVRIVLKLIHSIRCS